MGIVWFVLGAVCLIYYIICVSYAGFGTAFAFVWVIAGGAFFVLSLVCSLVKRNVLVIPVWLKIVFWSIFAVGMIVFVILEGCVISGMTSKPEENCDYVIVLGAQVRGTRITKSLARRLDAALEYYQNNPDATIIVSGGQGRGEDISEAAAMAGYLTEKGVPADKIILEDKSTNTNENLEFSIELIGNKDARVAIVTNNFHIFRAVGIAKAKGLSNVCGVPAASDEILFINYCVREAVGIMKDWAVGNLG